jgi:hypothetical protein
MVKLLEILKKKLNLCFFYKKTKNTFKKTKQKQKL